MWREKLINENSYRGFVGVIVAIASTPGGRVWWEQARIPLGDDVSDLVDYELANRKPDEPSWTDIFVHFRPE